MLEFLQVFVQIIDSFFKLHLLSAQLFVVLFQLLNIGVRWGSKTLFNELNRVSRFFRLFVKTHEYFRELVDDASALEVLSEFFFLLFSCLDTHDD